MRFLQITLSSPLQSWGERAKWDSRDTAKLPTKSGIIGLLGCCMGLERENRRLSELCSSLHMAVRVKKQGMVMTDFHTVQAPNGQRFPAAGGGLRGETIITPRQYLQDAVFDVFLWGDESVLDECNQAMLHPVWSPYLGRKSCVPSIPLLPVMIDAKDIDEAVRSTCDENDDAYQVEIEMLPDDVLRDDERVAIRHDNVVNASQNEYTNRKVRSSYIRSKEGTTCI